MSYMHIDNLYKNQSILLFRECYAMEKIHGTSAHIAWKDGVVKLFSGGEKAERFALLFDVAKLTENFLTLGHAQVTVYGEAYGGKCQGMSATYGKDLKFIAFEVLIGDTWLSVPNAEDVTHKLELEFVYYVKCDAEVSALCLQRDADSVQAVRNGMGTGHMREGVVLRPLAEFVASNGERVICKHKRAEFSERVTIPEIDPSKRELMENADAIAVEWVTDMRLKHVLDALGNPKDMKDVPKVITAMIEDVTREAKGEIVENKTVRKAIGSRAVKLYKKLVTDIVNK